MQRFNIMHLTPRQFVKQLAALQLPNTFNPYADQCQTYDKANAASLRRGTLIRLLERAVEQAPDAIWIGRDLGYRGGRRTGLALTDDTHMHQHAARWNVTIQRPTKGPPVSERTAAMIWQMLGRIDHPVFLWNVFPLHPHDAMNPLSNRQHSAAERDIGEQFLAQLIKLLKPSRLVALGNHAAASANRIFDAGEVALVRHPSYGGHREFIQKLERLYQLPEK